MGVGVLVGKGVFVGAVVFVGSGVCVKAEVGVDVDVGPANKFPLHADIMNIARIKNVVFIGVRFIV